MVQNLVTILYELIIDITWLIWLLGIFNVYGSLPIGARNSDEITTTLVGRFTSYGSPIGETGANCRVRENNMFRKVQYPGKRSQELIMSITLGPRNFANNGPFLMKLVPIKSPELGPSIGTKFVKNGLLSTKL